MMYPTLYHEEIPDAPQSSGGIKLKDHVKQIKKFHDRQVTGIGVVTEIKNGLVEVNFSGTQFYKIAPDCLETV